jgi:MinD-like ATPase involved in chromosome partitioning or flagellar assembly
VSLVVFCADKGSPGVTTTALALAATWPRPVGLAELDPSGGDLALRLTDPAGRHALAARPNLLSWAAAVRISPAPRLLWEHCQTAVGGLAVLPGLAGAEQAAGLNTLWPELAAALRSTAGRDVLADLGRLLPDSPALPVLAAADLAVVVTAATLEGLVHTRDRVASLISNRPAFGGPSVAVVVVGRDRDGPAAVEAVRAVLDRDGLPARVAGLLAIDANAVAAMHRGDRSARFGLSLLSRTARQVGSVLAAGLPALPPGADAASGAAPTPARPTRRLAVARRPAKVGARR